jgi:HTH-type transcriptional regulator, competence development regulator
MPKTLGQHLKEARQRANGGKGYSLREVERRTGIKNAHLSQVENDQISRPEMALLWQLAVLYGIDYERLLRLAGYTPDTETSGRHRQRMTVAMRAMDTFSPKEQEEVLQFISKVRSRKHDD